MAEIWTWIALNIISPINWNFFKKLFNKGKYYELTDIELDEIRRKTRLDYFFIMTRRKTHLTTWLISIGSWIKTGKLGYWSHSLMNIEYEWPNSGTEYRFIEATREGVHFSDFMKVFDCDSVCLRRPKNFTYVEWLDCFDAAIEDLGKKYDSMCDLRDEGKLNCGELLLHIVKKHSDKFPHLFAIVEKMNIIIPDMWYDSDDLITCYEVRH